MQTIVQASLKQQAGYVPLVANLSDELPVVTSSYADCVDAIMRKLAHDEIIKNCNPQILYLFLIWLLIGSDNPYNFLYKRSEIIVLQQIATTLLVIACGDDSPPRHLWKFAVDSSKDKYETKLVIAAISGLVTDAYNGRPEDSAKLAISLVTRIARTVEADGYGNPTIVYQEVCDYIYAAAKNWSTLDKFEVASMTRHWFFELIYPERRSQRTSRFDL